MLVGDPPYPGSTAQAVLGKIIQGLPVSATAARKSVPANVDAAIRKALEKLPADRFTSAQDFGKALSDPGFRHGEEVDATVGAGRGLWNPLSLAATGFAALFALGFAWSLLQPEPRQSVSRQVLSTEGWDGLEAPFGRYAAIAPDGSSMILPVAGQLALKMQSSTEITPIPGTEGAWDVVYSPDAQWIAYVVGLELFKRPILGGSPVRLAEDAQGTPNSVMALDWLDDGTILYEWFDADLSGRTRGIAQIPEDGGEPRIVFWPEEQIAPVWVHGLPGAQGALVISCLTGVGCTADRAQLYVVNLQDLTSELILEQVIRAWYAHTGHLVYVRNDGALFAAPFDLGSLEMTGSAIPLFGGVRVTVGWADMRIAPDGTLLYVEGSSSGATALQQLVVVDLEGNEAPLVLAPRSIGVPGVGSGVGWSPDGESVVFTSEGQIYTYNVELGTTPRQLTFDGNSRNAVFSPDGTRVAFTSTRDGTIGSDLFVKDLNDNSPPRSIISLAANQNVMQWPSDTLIVFERGSGTGDLWMVNLSDPDSARAEAYLSSEADLRRIVVSPDGSLAAYRSNESGANEIYIRSFPDPGERTIVSQGGGVVPFWSPDGNTLYYAVPGGEVRATRLQRNPVPVVLSTDSLFTRGPGVEPYPGSALHPDGDRFIFARNVAPSTARESGATQPERLILVQNFFEELRQVVPD